MEQNINVKKEFALSQIAPYFKDPSICGVDFGGNCQYLLPDGRMCVAGKNLLHPEEYTGTPEGIANILSYNQEELKPESRNILTGEEWQFLQTIHDRIAKPHPNDTLEDRINNNEYPRLFNYKELVEYAASH